MWVHCEVVLFWDANEPHNAHFALWFPSVSANVGTIHARIEIHINRETLDVSGSMHLRQRRLLEHLPDNEIAAV